MEEEWKPPPPVRTRLRSTFILLRDVPEGPLKGLPCFYAAWVMDIGGVRGDPLLRAAGLETGPDLKELTPAAIDAANVDTRFKATGGAQEVCYIAVPEDPDHPGILTLYRGFRSPVGGEETLLEEGNLDTLEKVHQRCRKVATGVLHVGILWRRVFARDWERTPGRIGETEPYVGTIWDSTRGIDKTFGLYKGDLSLGNPNDDVFPAWARLEITLAAPSALGYGKGETYLTESVGTDERSIRVAFPRALAQPGPDERFLKVDGEWMSYRVSRVDTVTGRIPVERGARDTVKAPHDSDAEVYVGLGESRDLRLLYHDRFAREGTRRSGSGRPPR